MSEELEPKRGRFSTEEDQFIKDNVGELTLDQIGTKLNRKAETIKNRAIVLGVDVSQSDPKSSLNHAQQKILHDFRKTPEWEQLKAEFTEAELEFFAHRYSKLLAQFQKEGCTATEETQIFLLIKYEILMNRNLKTSRKAIDQIKMYEEKIAEVYERYRGITMDDTARDAVTELENLRSCANDSQQSRTKEYNDLQKEHSAILKTLKATRDQRITKLESSSKDIVSLLKQLSDEEFRNREGRTMELTKISAEKEFKRLGGYHKYVDGSLDRPILSAETINEDEAT